MGKLCRDHMGRNSPCLQAGASHTLIVTLLASALAIRLSASTGYHLGQLADREISWSPLIDKQQFVDSIESYFQEVAS
jgi:hypothetical protein